MERAAPQKRDKLASDCDRIFARIIKLQREEEMNWPFISSLFVYTRLGPLHTFLQDGEAVRQWQSLNIIITTYLVYIMYMMMRAA